MLGYILHRMSSYFIAGAGTEREKAGKRKGNSTAGRRGRQEWDSKGTNPGNATAGRTMAGRNGNKNKICNMQSWERAKPLSRPDMFLEIGGRRITWCRICFRLHCDGGLE